MIDTSALVAAERASATWEAALSTLGNEPAVLPAIVCAELPTGVRLARSTARAAGRRAKIDALLAKVLVVDFGLPIAEKWAELFATLRRQGRLIPANDIGPARGPCASLRLAKCSGPGSNGVVASTISFTTKDFAATPRNMPWLS